MEVEHFTARKLHSGMAKFNEEKKNKKKSCQLSTLLFRVEHAALPALAAAAAVGTDFTTEFIPDDWWQMQPTSATRTVLGPYLHGIC